MGYVMEAIIPMDLIVPYVRTTGACSCFPPVKTKRSSTHSFSPRRSMVPRHAQPLNPRMSLVRLFRPSALSRSISVASARTISTVLLAQLGKSDGVEETGRMTSTCDTPRPTCRYARCPKAAAFFCCPPMETPRQVRSVHACSGRD